MPHAVTVQDGHESQIDYDVLWDGTPDAPWGPYIFAETEAQHDRTQRPFRRLRELDAATVNQILHDVRAMSIDRVAARHHVHPSTVDYLLAALSSGVLVME